MRGGLPPPPRAGRRRGRRACRCSRAAPVDGRAAAYVCERLRLQGAGHRAGRSWNGCSPSHPRLGAGRRADGPRRARCAISSWGRARPRAPAEARAHRLMARGFRAAGLRVAVQGSPCRARALAQRDRHARHAGARCLRIVMAHTDTTPTAPGANDNASGVGVVAALARRLRAIAPPCDVWLVATGAEERIYTGSPDHLGALALARRARPAAARGACAGRCRSTRSAATARSGCARPRAASRRGVEGALLRAGRAARRAGQLGARRGDRQLRPPRVRAARAARAKLGVGAGGEPCRHMPCDRPERLDPDRSAWPAGWWRRP